jgi:hypothetical protein
MTRILVTIAGVIAVLLGLLWVGQGLGYIHWPASSFMLDQRPWAVYGGILALVGMLVIMRAQRQR